MASYYDEHDCEAEETPAGSRSTQNVSNSDELLRLVRSLLAGQDVSDWFAELTDTFGTLDDGLAPPASKNSIENLERRNITGQEAEDDLKCPVCLLTFDEIETVVELPCEHVFHGDCILPWLDKTNSCPNCRHELPTDDPAYERRKKEKEEELARESRVKEYHDTMFG